MERMNKLKRPIVSEISNDTPRKRARKTILNSTPRKLHRTLTFHYSVIDEIRAQYKLCASAASTRQLVSSVFGAGHILAKYRATKSVCKEVGFAYHVISSNGRRDKKKLKHKHKIINMVTYSTKDKVKTFLRTRRC